MHWNLIDRPTGAVNHAIDWQFRVGDLVKLRLVNEMDSDHPMHHPFHIHGAGRFVVVARDGAPEENLVWKECRRGTGPPNRSGKASSSWHSNSRYSATPRIVSPK